MTQMTRKQALSRTIEILNNLKTQDAEEIKTLTHVLKSIYDDCPMSHWSRDAIFDAIDQYILEHNCLPNNRTLNDNSNLPTHSTIKNRFGLTTEEFYNMYYSDYIRKCKSRTYHYQTVEFWINDFKIQYVKLNYPSMREYDKQREPNTPCSRHLVKMLGLDTWNELLDFCRFEIKGQNVNSKVKPKIEKTIKHVKIVTLQSDIEKLRKINNELQQII